MPIFEYRCTQCQAIFSKLQMGSAVTNVSCPHCGSDQVERQLSTFASSTAGAASPGAPAGAGCAGFT